MAFDLLEIDGRSLLSAPLIERKEQLAEIVSDCRGVVLSRHIEKLGTYYYAAVVRNGLEGIMAKRRASRYMPGKRSWDWLKIKPTHSAVCFIVGYKQLKDPDESPSAFWRV